MTKNFFVLNISRKPAHKGLSDQATPMLATATVISPSECPKSLNMVPETQITMEKGIPIAMKLEITQRTGCLTFCSCAASFTMPPDRQHLAALKGESSLISSNQCARGFGGVAQELAQEGLRGQGVPSRRAVLVDDPF